MLRLLRNLEAWELDSRVYELLDDPITRNWYDLRDRRFGTHFHAESVRSSSFKPR